MSILSSLGKDDTDDDNDDDGLHRYNRIVILAYDWGSISLLGIGERDCDVISLCSICSNDRLHMMMR